MATNPTPTIGELREAAEITNAEIDAYLADPTFAPFHFAAGFEMNVAAAVNH